MKALKAALCALCLAGPAEATVNLVADGSFEVNPAERGGYNHVAGNTSFDGGHWHVTGVDVLHVDTAYEAGSGPPLVFNAQQGRNSLDLTGTGNSGPDDGVYQDVATVAGQLYTLRFWVGRATTIGSVGRDYLSNATMRLSIAGGPQMEFVNDQSVASGIAWTQFTQRFVAIAGTTRIAFRNGLGNDYLGLDSVSVLNSASVPEPVSWATMLGGFGLIGGAMRRSRRALVRANGQSVIANA